MRTTQIHGETYSPHCNTQPFLPIRLHRHKHRLCTKDNRAPMLAAAATTCPDPPCFIDHLGGRLVVATYSLVRRRRCPRFFLALDPSHVPPCSVIIVGITIMPIEQYGNQIGHQIVPAIGGVGEIVEAWLGPMGFLKYHWYPSEEASL